MARLSVLGSRVQPLEVLAKSSCHRHGFQRWHSRSFIPLPVIMSSLFLVVLVYCNGNNDYKGRWGLSLRALKDVGTPTIT